MKKKILVLLSIVLLSSTINMAYSKSGNSNELPGLIKLYKAGNYSECYLRLSDYVKKDPANAFAYYYLAMSSAQLGKKDEAITNYGKVLALTSPNGALGRYAQKGKTCLETPDKCTESTYSSPMEEFIRGKGAAVTEEVRSDYERLKIENMMREINRSDDIAPQKFEEYKDFSGAAPTNDEIVAALRTLQRAGLGSFNNYSADLSLLTGYQQKPEEVQMMNMLVGNPSINPQLIQSLLTNNMSLGF